MISFTINFYCSGLSSSVFKSNMYLSSNARQWAYPFVSRLKKNKDTNKKCNKQTNKLANKVKEQITNTLSSLVSLGSHVLIIFTGFIVGVGE